MMWWEDDITFCQEECERVDCMRNSKNIRDRTVPHSYSVERPEDCLIEEVTGVDERSCGYLCLMRPPMIGAVPKRGLVQVDFREGASMESGHHYWGRVVYNRELSPEEVADYELERTALAVLD